MTGIVSKTSVFEIDCETVDLALKTDNYTHQQLHVEYPLE